MAKKNWTVREILENEFWVCTNREMHWDSAIERIEKLLMYEIFWDCCALMKMKDAGLPDEALYERVRNICRKKSNVSPSGTQEE